MNCMGLSLRDTEGQDKPHPAFVFLVTQRGSTDRRGGINRGCGGENCGVLAD